MKHLTCLSAVVWLLLAACSTTKHLPEGEQLYIGQKTMTVDNAIPTPTGEIALTEIEGALARKPNNALLGSSTTRSPLPIGLWFYSGFQHYQKGFGKWIFNRFATTPVLISTVAPAIRQKVATNILHDYGYFNGQVSYELFPEKKDSLKVKLQYHLRMGVPYDIDTIEYRGFSPTTLQLMQLGRRRSVLRAGDQFNAVLLDEERTRISTLLRNMGYYYFRPDYMTYQADTTLVPGGHISLRMIPVAGMPPAAERTFFTGKTSFTLMSLKDEKMLPVTDTLTYKGINIYYHKKLKVRPNMLYRWINYTGFRRKRTNTDTVQVSRRRRPVGLYSEYRQSRIRERLTNVGIFSYLEENYTPRDSALVSDTLDVSYRAVLDKPYDAELDFNMKVKSNNQMGPGVSFTVTKKNVFGGGETWNGKIYGSYEWQTGKNSSSAMNSYEIGISSSLTFPRVLFPHMGDREYDFPATTTLRLYIDQLNRAKYYRLFAFGGNITYDFQPVPYKKHSLTPFRLTFNVLRNPTPAFEEIQQQNPALYISLRNQFIPAMEYTYTFDNSSSPLVKNPIWWQTTLASAGNLTSLLYTALGKPFSQPEKKLLGVPFAQYIKVNSEFRYLYKITPTLSLATRIAAGVICSYGNSTSAPYTEMFYVGGANSVRAFASRSIGPGGSVPEKTLYSFIDQVGDIRFEANAELRFPLFGDVHGAVFLDAGNVWMLRHDDQRPEAQFKLSHFAKQLALGTGLGLRYDMDILVFRLDCGVGIHAPYDTGKKGYYNLPRLKDGLALHFAIGYPF
jgi:hypothetical protein